MFNEDAVPRTGVRSLAASMATEDHYMGSAAATGDLRDVLTWDARYSLSGMRPVTDSRTTRWNLVARDPVRRTDQNSRGRATHRLQSIMAGAALAPVPSISLALRGAHSRMEGASRNSTAFVDTDTAGIRWNNATHSTLEHSIPSSQVTAAASVERARIRFTSEARASFVDENFQGDYATGAGYRFMTTAMAARQRERVVRNDIGLRFAGIGVDFGQQSRFRTTTARHDDAAHDGATLSRTFRYDADVHAGYLAAHRAIGSVRTQAGLRLEADRTRIQRETDSTRSVVRLFPSFDGEWGDARRSLLYRLSYGRRIDRPAPEMVNPFSMGEDDMNEIIGNPSLVPEVSDQVEVGIERRGASFALQLAPFLRWTRDPIRPLKTVTTGARSTTTLENLTSSRSAGADGSLRTRLSTGTVITVAGSVARMETTADTFSTSGVYATARLIVDHPLTENTTAQLYAFRRSAQAIEQGEIRPALTSELALIRRLAGDKGRLTLRLSDPFRTDRLQFRIANSTFRQESYRRTPPPLLSLFASWAVGGAPREEAPIRTEERPRIF